MKRRKMQIGEIVLPAQSLSIAFLAQTCILAEKTSPGVTYFLLLHSYPHTRTEIIYTNHPCKHTTRHIITAHTCSTIACSGSTNKQAANEQQITNRLKHTAVNSCNKALDLIKTGCMFPVLHNSSVMYL